MSSTLHVHGGWLAGWWLRLWGLGQRPVIPEHGLLAGEAAQHQQSAPAPQISIFLYNRVAGFVPVHAYAHYVSVYG